MDLRNNMAVSEKIQTSFVSVLTILSLLVMILNMLGGVVSGIWLAILGEWGEIFRGILFLVISSFIISFALMPGLLLAGPAMMAIERGKKILGLFFGSLSVFYTVALIVAWCIWVLWLFVSSATESSLIPLLIWSYGVALGPWMWLAQKDQQGGGNEFSIITTFFAQISYLLAMILFFAGTTLEIITVVFGSIMLVGAILQIINASVSVVRQQKYAMQADFDEELDDAEDFEVPDISNEKTYIYCPDCGHKIESDSRFCEKCGEKVK